MKEKELWLKCEAHYKSRISFFYLNFTKWKEYLERCYGNWFLPHLNFRNASVERNIIHDFRCIVRTFFCTQCFSELQLKWCCGGNFFSRLYCVTEWCIRCNNSNCDWIVVSHNNLCNQFYCLRRKGKSHFLFPSLNLIHFLSLFSTLNQFRSIFFWQSHLFRNILVFESIHSAQGIVNGIHRVFLYFILFFISIALALHFLIKL